MRRSFSEGLKVGKSRVLGRVVGVVDKEVCPFAHDAQKCIPSGVLNGQGRRISFAKDGDKFIVGRFGRLVLEGGEREGEGKEGEEKKEKGKSTTKERAKAGGFKPPLPPWHRVFVSA
jgi:hypothetical protein